MAFRPTSLLLSLSLPLALGAGEASLTVLEPAKAGAAAARVPERARWSWNQSPATVTATGDLAWSPKPFAFAKGASVRYIDFNTGSDDATGTATGTPWKHHPWDPAASGAAKSCTGIHTYVFKRGVTYRGSLVTKESGKLGDPIRLTSDPAWGTGEAVIAGSERITGWKKGSDLKGLPEADKVWWVDVPFQAMNLWEVAADVVSTRVALARMPNWKVSDPNDVMSEWWQLEQPEWWTGKWKIDFNGHRAHMGVDTKNLTLPAETYVGAIIRPEFSILMSTPFPTRVEGFDEQKKALIFQGIWTGDSEQHWTGNRYYLEDKPHFLDVPGEFWLERKGDGGRLYLRLPGDRDPNKAVVEAGRHINLIESRGVSELAISGLTFRSTNTHADLSQPGWGHGDVANAAVRVQGSCEGLTIANCRFLNIAGKALRLDASKGDQRFDRLIFNDNEVVETDHGAIDVNCGGRGSVEVLRNRMHIIGQRPHRQDWGHALCVGTPETMHIAGNMLDRCYGAGIFVFGGKGGGDARDVAFSRSLIYGNRVVDSLLAANDWGGIETWQCGPHYVFNNISGNAVGYWNSTWKPNEKGSACLGFNYYFDGSFRNAVFNNVAWGGTADRDSKMFAQAPYYEAVPTTNNSFYNNTAADFKLFSNWSPAGGRHLMLGNLAINIAGPIFQWGKLKEDKGDAPADYPHTTTALSRNVFADCGDGKVFGLFEANGKGYPDLAAMQAAFAARKPLAADIGTATTKPVVKDAGKTRDFHPVAGSPAKDGGVKAFVPWAIARTVGEWHFRRNQADATIIDDDHWYATSYLINRETYHQTPVWPLTGVGISAKDFAMGPLEDWVDGALSFDGKDQHAVLSDAVMNKPYQYEHDNKKLTAQGADLANPDIARQNLLIEVHIQAKAGQGAAAIVSKLAESGYRLALNQAGGVTLTLAADGKTSELASGAIIADGKWHHVLAEVDRSAGTATIYTDGKMTAQGKLSLAAEASLSNHADLVVGKGFTGALEYLRIARATLAESRTTIEELYDWQLDGPFLRDFAGKEPKGGRRHAGAFEPK